MVETSLGLARLKTRGGKVIADIPLATFGGEPESITYRGIKYAKVQEIECGEDLVPRHCYVAEDADFFGTGAQWTRANFLMSGPARLADGTDLCVSADKDGVYIKMTWDQAAALRVDLIAAFAEGLLARDALVLLKGLELQQVRERGAK